MGLLDKLKGMFGGSQQPTDTGAAMPPVDNTPAPAAPAESAPAPMPAAPAEPAAPAPKEPVMPPSTPDQNLPQ